MKSTKTSIILFVALGLIVCLSGISLAKKPVGAAFTYSGKLVKDGEPVDDPCDFLCTLWDDPCAVAGPNQVGDTLVFDELEVKKGKFRLRLDFGSDPNVFNGEMRWLEIGVRAGYLDDPCEYTILEPRVELTAAPYAVNAGNISGKKVVKSEHLGDKAVDPNKIADKAVRKEHIEDKAVDPNKIADKAVRKEHIENRAVDPNKIAKKAVKAEHLEEGIVDANKLGDLSGYNLETSYNIGPVISLKHNNTSPDYPVLYLESSGGGGGGLSVRVYANGEGSDDPAIIGVADYGVGVRGDSLGSVTQNAIGVYGGNNNIGPGNGGTGVYGFSNKGVGVFGRSEGSNSYGVYGENPAGGWAGYFSGKTVVTQNLYVSDKGNAAEPSEALHVDGKVYIEEMDAAQLGGNTVKWENNRLVVNASSARYKDNIQPLTDDPEKILQAESKSFTWKSSGRSSIGFIAEDFDTLGLTDLVIYKDGRPEAVHYDLVPVYLLEVLKKQVQAIEQLKQDNESLKQRIEALERSAHSNQLPDIKEVGK